MAWFIDLDELPRLPRWLRPLAEFRAGDHLGDPDRSIRANVERWLAERGIDLAGGPVWMLANARVLGYVFNPLSLYWCHRIDGALACVVAEVHNTYGERHCYLLHPDDAGRASAAKEFYVSPFLTVDGHYEMSVPRPGERLAVTVARCTSDGEHRAPRRVDPGGPTPGNRARTAAATAAHTTANTPGLGPHPGARHRAVAAPIPDHPTQVGQQGRSGGATMTSTPDKMLTRAVPKPNEGVWPGLSTPPRSSGRARIAESLFRRAVRSLDVRVLLPDGERLGSGEPDSPRMNLVRPSAFFHRLGATGLDRIRRGGYMAGDWVAGDDRRRGPR